jgi:hypothetical protein
MSSSRYAPKQMQDVLKALEDELKFLEEKRDWYAVRTSEVGSDREKVIEAIREVRKMLSKYREDDSIDTTD